MSFVIGDQNLRAALPTTPFAQDRIPSPVTNIDLLRTSDQQIQGETHRAETAHFTDLGQMAALEGHHYKNGGIGIPAPLTTGQGTEQDHLLGGVALHQPLRAWIPQ